MSNYIYYCNTCNTLDSDFERNQKIRCPGCGNDYLPLLITEETWFEIDDDEKRKVMYRAITSKNEQKSDYLRMNNPKMAAQGKVGPSAGDSTDDFDYEDDDDGDDDGMLFGLKKWQIALILVAVAIITAVITLSVL